MRPQRDFMSLLDRGVQADVHAEHFCLDSGSFNGKQIKWLCERCGCRIAALDIAQSTLHDAMVKGLTVVKGDVQVLPFQFASFDFIWCRDMLECVSDPAVTLREFTHVLSLSGSVMLYAAFSTLEFESKEHTQLIKAVNQPACWAEGSASVDDAIAAADFEIVSLDLMSPEYTERNMLDRDAKLTSEFATLARLRRASARIKAAMGTVWYERLVGQMKWSLYILLDKIQTIAWVLRKPIGQTVGSMPTVLRVDGYKFWFYEADLTESFLVHVGKDGKEGKFWL